MWAIWFRNILTICVPCTWHIFPCFFFQFNNFFHPLESALFVIYEVTLWQQSIKPVKVTLHLRIAENRLRLPATCEIQFLAWIWHLLEIKLETRSWWPNLKSNRRRNNSYVKKKKCISERWRTKCDKEVIYPHYICAFLKRKREQFLFFFFGGNTFIYNEIRNFFNILFFLRQHIQDLTISAKNDNISPLQQICHFWRQKDNQLLSLAFLSSVKLHQWIWNVYRRESLCLSWVIDMPLSQASKNTLNTNPIRHDRYAHKKYWQNFFLNH